MERGQGPEVFRRSGRSQGYLSGKKQLSHLKRAFIAAAIEARPKVLLFDEPTSALDPELVGAILR